MFSFKVLGNRVSLGDHFSFSIERTLRIPDDGKVYPLPPSCGSFPIFKVEDYQDRVPAHWVEHGGIFFPMYQREAAWLSFNGSYEVPVAVIVAAGKVCAVSGKPWSGELNADPQNYCVAGGTDPQHWIDGFKTEDGSVSQFAAMPLGMGYTVEKQITGEEKHGGMQLQVFEIKEEHRRKRPITRSRGLRLESEGLESFGGQMLACCAASFGSPEASLSSAGAEMGLGAGGSIEQAIKKDPYGVDKFDTTKTGKLFIHIVNSVMFKQITGQAPPDTPIDAASYTRQGYPWFSTYEEDAGKDIKPQEELAEIKTIAEIDQLKEITGQQNDSTIPIHGNQVKQIGKDPKGGEC